jgi:hypothetical protein
LDARGSKSGTIKPLTMNARTLLKFRGNEHNEKQWTAAERDAEGQKFRKLGVELVAFMQRTGLVPPHMTAEVATN